MTYFPTPLQVQYRERYGVSLPCSGWERVGPPCSYHQEKNIVVAKCWAPGIPIESELGRSRSIPSLYPSRRRGERAGLTASQREHQQTLTYQAALGSGGRIRTYDLWVMSPTSCHCSTPHCKSVKGDFEQYLWPFCGHGFRDSPRTGKRSLR